MSLFRTQYLLCHVPQIIGSISGKVYLLVQSFHRGRVIIKGRGRFFIVRLPRQRTVCGKHPRLIAWNIDLFTETKSQTYSSLVESTPVLKTIFMKATNPCSVEDLGFTVRKDADRPRWQVVLSVSKTDLNRILRIIVRQKSRTRSRFCLVYMSLLSTIQPSRSIISRKTNQLCEELYDAVNYYYLLITSERHNCRIGRN